MANFSSEREYWLDTLNKLAGPVLEALGARQLRVRMPVEGQPQRAAFSHLEALGRLLTGIAPWLETGSRRGDEGLLRAKYAVLARAAIDAGTDPESPDYMNFEEDYQPVVDTAFLAHAILRAPTELWDKLDNRVRQNVVRALKLTRSRKPFFNNWLLFAAMTEALLYKAGEDWDPMRIDYALKQHEQWYVGDGFYGDGPAFHWDYYNSYVILPMLVDVLETVGQALPEWQATKEKVLRRARRHAVIQERLIAPDGTFPAIGRSLTYRTGAFQLLAQMALRNELDDSLQPAQVRCALTAVMRRTLEPAGTFHAQGWLQIGLSGHQPSLGEGYISTGSLYLCSASLLPLGLPEDHPFWQGKAEWTSRQIWSGRHVHIDHALYD
ncbi:DUF2264 domain-containing protein [Paenibacillus sp. y28]|uniref:DUF2264 domain-containing protein n=1 Tax=Paenibacillus sp. y28 TaxID=3129110 RepID=UPI003015AE4C